MEGQHSYCLAHPTTFDNFVRLDERLGVYPRLNAKFPFIDLKICLFKTNDVTERWGARRRQEELRDELLSYS